jgi:hypothetical protein
MPHGRACGSLRHALKNSSDIGATGRSNSSIAPDIAIDNNWSSLERQPGAILCVHRERKHAPGVSVHHFLCLFWATAINFQGQSGADRLASIMSESDSFLGIFRRPRRRDAEGPPISAVRRHRGWRYLLLAGLIAAMLAMCHTVGATCNDDCSSEYLSSLKDCRAQYQDGQEDVQDLEDCLVDTRSEYDDCIDDCTSTGAGGVVACSADAHGLRLISFAPSRR